MLKTMLSLNIEDTFRRALKTHLRVHVMYTQKKRAQLLTSLVFTWPTCAIITSISVGIADQGFISWEQ